MVAGTKGAVSLLLVFACAACGGSTEEDQHSSTGGAGGAGGAGGGAGTGGAGGSGGSAGTSGTGGNAACTGYTPQASPEEIAKSPRPSETAELLAIETAHTLAASDALYDRLVAELSQIYILDPSVSAISVFSTTFVGSLAVQLDASAWAEYQAGKYHAWDCPNQAYGAIEQGAGGQGTMLEFGGKRLNGELLAKEYGALPGVAEAYQVPFFGDGPDVCLQIDGDTHYFIFDAAGGDCPAGCTVHYYSAFSATLDPVVTALGNYDPATSSTAPKWYDDLADCRTRL